MKHTELLDMVFGQQRGEGEVCWLERLGWEGSAGSRPRCA